MKLSLPPKSRKLIEERVRSGKYATAEDVVAAALLTLDQTEQMTGFAPGELDRLVEEGERSLRRDGPIPAQRVFKEVRQRSARRRNKPA